MCTFLVQQGARCDSGSVAGLSVRREVLRVIWRCQGVWLCVATGFNGSWTDAERLDVRG